MSKMPLYAFSDSSSGSFLMANGENLNNEKLQDNPVGVVKYIYVIRNKINDKVYVGQSINVENRFKEHIQDKDRKQYSSAIDGAIKKYGESNFWYEIIEGPICNYDEREKYWIKFFNSLVPNGYNIMEGGSSPPINKGIKNNKSKFTKEKIEELKILLLNPNITLSEIANYFNVSYRTISNFNIGNTYFDKDIDYPIRKFQCSGEHSNMVDDETVKNVIYDILNTDYSFRYISQKYHINCSQVKEINQGDILKYKNPGLTYPLSTNRQRINIGVVNKIKKELISGILSKHQIAKKFNVSYPVVSNINSGRSYFDEKAVYPLKKHEGRYDYDETTWETIRDMLKQGVSPKKIASTLHLPNVSIVYDINNGKTHVSNKYNYPIQKFSPYLNLSLIKKITEDIVSTSLSLSKIAKKYNLNKSTVIQIKNGTYKKNRLPGYNYPLRPNR